MQITLDDIIELMSKRINDFDVSEGGNYVYRLCGETPSCGAMLTINATNTGRVLRMIWISFSRIPPIEDEHYVVGLNPTDFTPTQMSEILTILIHLRQRYLSERLRAPYKILSG